MGVFLQTLKKPGFLSEHLCVTSTVAHSQKPLGSVPIIFGGTEGKTILVPKYLQTIQKDIKTGQIKIKHNKKGQKCRSNNKHEKLLPVSPSHYKSPIPSSHFTCWCLSHTLSSYSSSSGGGSSASLWERSENKAMPGTEWKTEPFLLPCFSQGQLPCTTQPLTSWIMNNISHPSYSPLCFRVMNLPLSRHPFTASFLCQNGKLPLFLSHLCTLLLCPLHYELFNHWKWTLKHFLLIFMSFPLPFH